MLYRILTQDKNQKGIRKILDRLINGYTIIETTGIWKGEQEDSLIIEIDSLGQEGYLDNRVIQIAEEIKELNNQDEVFIQLLSSGIWTI